MCKHARETVKWSSLAWLICFLYLVMIIVCFLSWMHAGVLKNQVGRTNHKFTEKFLVIQFVDFEELMHG